MSDDEFISSVLYFHQYKDDVTRLSGWDEARCARLMPAFHKAWTDRNLADYILDRVARTYRIDDADA